MTRRAVVTAMLRGEPPICIQNVARRRWQAECDGGHRRGRLLLRACRTPPTPPTTPARQGFRGLVSVRRRLERNDVVTISLPLTAGCRGQRSAKGAAEQAQHGAGRAQRRFRL